MEKAYAISGLVDELKAKGLDVAEDAAKAIYLAIDAWLMKSAAMSPSKMDDLLIVILPVARGYVLEQIDKINDKKD